MRAAYDLEVKLLWTKSRRRWLGLRREVSFEVRGRPGALKRFLDELYEGLPQEHGRGSPAGGFTFELPDLFP